MIYDNRCEGVCISWSFNQVNYGRIVYCILAVLAVMSLIKFWAFVILSSSSLLGIY
jgi:hypothetical protein